MCPRSPPQPPAADPGAFPQAASEKLEEGQRALREARQVQQEQQARLQLVREQHERLWQQEQRVHQASRPPAPASRSAPSHLPPSQPRPSLSGVGDRSI